MQDNEAESCCRDTTGCEKSARRHSMNWRVESIEVAVRPSARATENDEAGDDQPLLYARLSRDYDILRHIANLR